MAREIDNGSLVVNEGDIVIVSNTQKKRDGVFSKVGTVELVEGDALVGLHPVIDDKTKHRSLIGKLLPNLSPQNSVLLTGKEGEFVEGRDFSISVPNKLDKFRYFLGKRLLGW